MAGRRGRLSDEEAALVRAQTEAVRSEQFRAMQELQQKAALAREQMGSERAMATERIGLGQAELGQKGQQANLAAALEAYGLGSKEAAEATKMRSDIASDLTRRPDVDAETMATALAESGQPGLYNARARKKVEDREKAITTVIPALQAAGSDAEREKKIKPGLEAAFPGAYVEAIARAYPKPGQAVPAATPKLWEGSSAPAAGGGDKWTALASTLLGKAGVTPVSSGGVEFARNGYPILPNTTEPNYAGIGHGSLEGSQRVEGGIRTPSGGFIGTDYTPGVATLIEPRANAAVATTPASTEPTFRGAGAGSSWAADAAQLIAPDVTIRGRGEFAGTYPLQPNTGGVLDLPSTPPAYVDPEERKRILAAMQLVGR